MRKKLISRINFRTIIGSLLPCLIPPICTLCILWLASLGKSSQWYLETWRDIFLNPLLSVVFTLGIVALTDRFRLPGRTMILMTVSVVFDAILSVVFFRKTLLVVTNCLHSTPQMLFESIAIQFAGYASCALTKRRLEE